MSKRVLIEEPESWYLADIQTDETIMIDGQGYWPGVRLFDRHRILVQPSRCDYIPDYIDTVRSAVMHLRTTKGSPE